MAADRLKAEGPSLLAKIRISRTQSCGLCGCEFYSAGAGAVPSAEECHLNQRHRSDWRKNGDNQTQTECLLAHIYKVHLSSPKSESAVRSHADYVDANFILPVLERFRQWDTEIDFMIEAKESLMVCYFGNSPYKRVINLVMPSTSALRPPGV
jgi:hypothetical protein